MASGCQFFVFHPLLFYSSVQVYLILFTTIRKLPIVNAQYARGEIEIVEENYIYEISDAYDFYIPDVNVQCKCSCVKTAQSFCHFTYGERNSCNNFFNSSTTCTEFNQLERDQNICPYYYELCCETYFTKNKVLNHYTAIYLKFHEVILKVKRGGDFYTVGINKTMDILYFYIADNLYSIHKNKFIPLLSDNWYFVERGRDELFFSKYTNPRGEVNIYEIGWFRWSKLHNRPSKISSDVLKRLLNLKPLDCKSYPPAYKWNLNSEHYSKDGKFLLPKSKYSVMEMYTEIKYISLEQKKKKIRIQCVSSSKINTVESVKNLPFNFKFSRHGELLTAQFTKGSGKFRIIFIDSGWRKTGIEREMSINIYSPILNKTILCPLQFLSAMCCSQNRQQLCIIAKSNKEEYSNSFVKQIFPIKPIFPYTPFKPSETTVHVKSNFDYRYGLAAASVIGIICCCCKFCLRGIIGCCKICLGKQNTFINVKENEDEKL